MNSNRTPQRDDIYDHIGWMRDRAIVNLLASALGLEAHADIITKAHTRRMTGKLRGPLL